MQYQITFDLLVSRDIRVILYHYWNGNLVSASWILPRRSFSPPVTAWSPPAKRLLSLSVVLKSKGRGEASHLHSDRSSCLRPSLATLGSSNQRRSDDLADSRFLSAPLKSPIGPRGRMSGRRRRRRRRRGERKHGLRASSSSPQIWRRPPASIALRGCCGDGARGAVGARRRCAALVVGFYCAFCQPPTVSFAAVGRLFKRASRAADERLDASGNVRFGRMLLLLQPPGGSGAAPEAGMRTLEERLKSSPVHWNLELDVTFEGNNTWICMMKEKERGLVVEAAALCVRRRALLSPGYMDQCLVSVTFSTKVYCLMHLSLLYGTRKTA